MFGSLAEAPKHKHKHSKLGSTGEDEGIRLLSSLPLMRDALLTEPEPDRPKLAKPVMCAIFGDS